MFGITYATPASIAYAEAESAAAAAAIAQEDRGRGDDEIGEHGRLEGGRGLEERRAEGGNGDDEPPLELPLRVYLYPLPAAFNFGLLQASPPHPTHTFLNAKYSSHSALLRIPRHPQVPPMPRFPAYPHIPRLSGPFRLVSRSWPTLSPCRLMSLTSPTVLPRSFRLIFFLASFALLHSLPRFARYQPVPSRDSQAQWNVGCRLDILARHGVPPSWNFNASSSSSASSASSSSSSSSSSSLVASADDDADGDGDNSLDQAAAATFRAEEAEAVAVAADGERVAAGEGDIDAMKGVHLPMLEQTDGLARLSGWSEEAVAVAVPCYHNFPYYWQHSVEYYMTLSLLFGASLPVCLGSEAVVRVEEPSHADVVFLPYFSTLAFRLKASARLNAQLLPVLPRMATHPLLMPAVYPVTFANASRDLLQPVRKLAVDLDMYPPMDADPLIDVVVPYAALVPAYADDPGSWQQRPTLLYFRGNKWRAGHAEGQAVRRALAEVLVGQRGVVFEAALASDEDNIMGAAGGLRRAKYCLSPEGDTSSSCRLYDSILSGCIPVVVSDSIELPFEDALDYSSFALFVPTALALRPGHLLELLQGQSRAQWQRRWSNMRRLRKHFEFSSLPEPGGAEDTVWRAVSRRMRGSTGSAGAQRNRRQRLRLLLRQLAHYGLNASHLQQPVHLRPPVHL
ncbi:unnamed protein product [Closterium sp. Naga37s-1]|nr:unnamed protein product [Closterium sp. Naga37s-1]